MTRLWERIKTGYLRIIDPLVAWLVARRVTPNVITTVGTLTYVVGGVIYATGHIRAAGWWLGLTAVFDVLDGKVARATGARPSSGRSTTRRSTAWPTARFSAGWRVLRPEQHARAGARTGRARRW
jgi:hypothetical protein